MTPFGSKVRALREERGIRQTDMAKALGVSSAYLSALEHGKRGRPSWHVIQRVISYFNIIWDDAEELVRLARISHPRITIDTAGLDPRATELANLLADQIGKLERGHSVIYLGVHTIDGIEHVNFWSSNQPAGYGHKLVPRSKIAWAVFSRLENPAGIADAKALPPSDAYLASLLGARSSREEVRAKCAVE